MPEDGQYDQNT